MRQQKGGMWPPHTQTSNEEATGTTTYRCWYSQQKNCGQRWVLKYPVYTSFQCNRCWTIKMNRLSLLVFCMIHIMFLGTPWSTTSPFGLTHPCLKNAIREWKGPFLLWNTQRHRLLERETMGQNEWESMSQIPSPLSQSPWVNSVLGTEPAQTNFALNYAQC